ncbi:protein OCTOPUS [Rutidosis leptorrhynchoides]|uniref:protein OCTOPUS n=1 Tax=Rutidosis leptorrhynchoides TaxID=125765 RepID=UPI003A99BCED
MNPVTEQQPAPPALPLQPPRSSFSCDRHPDENFTGFCPSCLCERLTTLDQSDAAGASSSSRRNSTSSSTAAAAIKSLFKLPSSSSATKNSLLPELRRTKSFSASKNEELGFSACVNEPQRKSCDVRGRNTLSSLFSIHDDVINIKPRHSYSQQSNVVVLETNPEDEEEDDEDDQFEEIDVVDEEIRVTDVVNDFDNNNITEETVEIKNKTEVKDVTESVLMPMKDHIHIDIEDSHLKKSSRSNFWSAASVLTKKWQKWRRKQKSVTSNGTGVLSATLPVEKPISRQYRETQSEIADYGFGRRSCDADPRFSLDAGRVSFDDPRYSFDEPRASWDGYLIGRTFPRLPPMVEDAPVEKVHVARCDSQIPVEEVRVVDDDNVPGGSLQTREYYLDSSSSKRRKSLDRSNSIRRMAAAVVAELDETKVAHNVALNTKVSPSNIDDNNPIGASRCINIENNEPPRVSNSNSLRDDCSETFELGFRDNGMGVIGVEKKEMKKPPRRWRWKLWGFIQRRNNKDEDEDRCSTVSGVGRSYAESWQDLRTNGINNNEVNGVGVNRNVLRSNSSVSWRSSSLRKSNINGKVIGNEHGFGNGKIKRGGDEFVVERNRSARLSPNHNIDNGLLRFYLAPLSGNRRGGGIGIATGKSRPASNSHSIARSMLRLY